MAAHKVSTMVNKNTHKLVPLLVHAILEWVLIALLLLNSLFSYLISKFATRFGLQKPCLWCSRVDHIWEKNPEKLSESTDLFCESHAVEISHLHYCSNHRRLVRSKDKNVSNTSCLCPFCDEDDLDPYRMFRRNWTVKDSDEDEEEEDCLSSSSMFICYEKELAMEDSKTGSNGSGDFVRRTLSEFERDNLIEDVVDEAENMEMDSLSKASEQVVITTQEIHSLQINEKKAVMTRLIDLPVTESEVVTSKTLVSNQMSECESEKHKNHPGTEYEEERQILDKQVASETSESDQISETHLENGIDMRETALCLPGKESKEERQVLGDQVTSDNLMSYQMSECESEKEQNNHLEKTTGTRDMSLFETKEDKSPDTPTSMEQLKTVLKSERNTLSALYAELEEERNASAVAANETMAMITRLQEEKAAVQMEALQYQRMMEEQSEYDQEALQLLNDLMVKREKEKHELERELEVYKKKVIEYEEREKLRRRWDSDDDYDNDDNNVELEDENNGNRLSYENSGVLDDSLTEFEEERLSILDQLKSLEDKLVKLSDEDNDNDNDKDKDNDEVETIMTLGSMAKKLLPFLDEVETEDSKERVSESDVNYSRTSAVIEEEVDYVYERLEALEADREFLKNCMSSIKKGDKGMDLLQEILQHLRDLRNIELRMRTSNDEDEALNEIEVS